MRKSLLADPLLGEGLKQARPAVKPWKIPKTLRQKMERLEATSEWLANPPKEVLRRYQGKYVAARDCRVIAASENFEGLNRKLRGAEPESYIIACFHSRRLAFDS